MHFWHFHFIVLMSMKQVADFSVEGKENEPACTLGKIYRLSSGNGTELKEYFTSLSQQPYLSEATKTAFSGLIS